jgi:hypothetical protein
MANSNSIINIKDFFDRHKGLQRSNRFSMSLSLPETLPQISNDDLQPLAVTIGSRAIDGIADNLAGYGLGRTVPRSQKFPQGVLLTFAVTNDNFITDFFDTWFNTIYSGGRQKGYYGAPFQLSYYDDIILDASMNINLLDLNGNINRTFTFYEIYPIETLPIVLDMIDANKYSTYQVLINFRDFTFTSPS